MAFPGGSRVKDCLPTQATHSQYSSLGKSKDRGTWQARLYRVAESAMTEHTHK